jgi:nucleoside 2-deoxyribosyltransferase
MKKLCICGSFRFIHEMEALERRLKTEKIDYHMSKKTDAHGIMECLKKIDDADVVYIVNPKGYIGKSVSVDIGYAYAKNKAIYAMHLTDDPPVMGLINGVLSPERLIDIVKEGSARGLKNSALP